MNSTFSSNKTQYNQMNFSIYNLSLLLMVPIRIFGSITNLINAIIFRNKEFKDNVFKYLLINSISEFIYLFILNLTVFSYCGSFCGPNIRESFYAKFILLYIDIYITSCLAMFSIFIELTVSLQRLLVVSNLNICKIIKQGSPYLVMSILLIISLITYLPFIITQKISRISFSNETTENTNYYEIKKIIKSNFNSYYGVFITVFRGPVCTFFLTIINLRTLIKFKKQMQRKQLIKSTKGIKKFFFNFFKKRKKKRKEKNKIFFFIFSNLFIIFLFV